MSPALNVGIWTTSATDISKDGLYRGSDPEVLLLQTVLLMLRFRNWTWVPVVNNGWYNASDPSSLAGQIRSGLIDVHSSLVLLTPERFFLLDFVFPFSFEHLSLAVPKTQPPIAQLKIFSMPVWALVLLVLFLIRILLLSRGSWVSYRARKLRQSQIIFILISVGFSAAFKLYKINITAMTITSASNAPKTIQQLANGLHTGKFRMIDKSSNGFVYEQLNSTNISGVAAILKESLVHFPPIHVETRENVCKNVAKNSDENSLSYVYLNTDVSIIEFCSLYLSKIDIVAVESAGFYMRSYIVSPNNTRLRSALAELSTSGLMRTARMRISLLNKRDHILLQKKSPMKKSLRLLHCRRLHYFDQVFRGFFACVLMNVVCFILELSYKFGIQIVDYKSQQGK